MAAVKSLPAGNDTNSRHSLCQLGYSPPRNVVNARQPARRLAGWIARDLGDDLTLNGDPLDHWHCRHDDRDAGMRACEFNRAPVIAKILDEHLNDPFGMSRRLLGRKVVAGLGDNSGGLWQAP